MKCPKCETDVAPEAVFCHKCGAPLKEPSGGKKAAASASEPSSTQTAGRLGLGGRREDVAEEALWEGGYSPKAMIGTWIVATLVTVALLVAMGLLQLGAWWWLPLAAIAAMWVVLLLVLFFTRLDVHYRLTNQRFVHKQGIFKRVTDRLEVIDIDDVTFEQGLIERLVGVGRIKITSSDRTHPQLVLRGIDNVDRVANLIDEARRAERQRRGLYVESV